MDAEEPELPAIRLKHAGQIEPGTLDDLLPEVYSALMRIARAQLRRERPGHTLDTSGLVHEAYLKLTESFPELPESREQFMFICAQLMRQVLVDHARRRGRQKRGGDAVLTTYTDSVVAAAPGDETNMLAINDALERLERVNPDYSRIVECRFFAGMSIEETAVALDTSPSSVKRHWRFARAWLQNELTPPAA
ncbi:MAG: ECF-type sigma factor [Xanthomonadales bacterium]|nr:ECF-type sigma factor [Xanthomonadales bacterium]